MAGMEIRKIDENEKEECAEKIIAFAEEFYKRDD